MKNIKYSFLLCFFLLCSCVSSEQAPYDKPTDKQVLHPYPKKTSSREIAYLKNISLMDESNFQFISKQMKNVIKKYKKIKQQLVAMESKIDQILKQQEFLAKQTQQTKEFIEEDFGEEAGFKQAEEADEERGKEPLSLNEKSSKEESGLTTEEDPLLWEEEITDDTILFQEEDNKENSHTTKKRSSSAQKKRIKEKKKNNMPKQPAQLATAKKLFQKKSYESAISEFQKYRDLHPKGAYYPEATFYIGESFKNLKMPIEAEVFFKEVVETHPQSLWASRAKKNLQE